MIKTGNFIWIALAVAIVGLGLWWFMQPTVVTPEKTAEAAMPAKVETAASVAPPTIAPPVLPPAPKPGTAPVAHTQTPDPNADPQADLKTAIPEIARLFRADNYLALYHTYTPPDELDPQAIQDFREQPQNYAKMAAEGSPILQHLQELDETRAQSYDALENQTPTYNAAGDVATYKQALDNGDGDPSKEPLVFVKINGKWYIKSGYINTDESTPPPPAPPTPFGGGN